MQFLPDWFLQNFALQLRSSYKYLHGITFLWSTFLALFSIISQFFKKLFCQKGFVNFVIIIKGIRNLLKFSASLEYVKTLIQIWTILHYYEFSSFVQVGTKIRKIKLKLKLKVLHSKVEFKSSPYIINNGNFFFTMEKIWLNK